jgi:hypothetical protein
MFIKGFVAGATLGLMLPLALIGIAGGAAMANNRKKTSGCKHCCVVCNGSCYDSPDQNYRNNKTMENETNR